MQWKSFVFILATAGSGFARSHGQHKHRHGVRHEHEVEARAVEAVIDLAGFFDLEPITVTETAWECCTTSSFSLTPTSTAPVTFIELPTETSETETTTETSTSTSTSTSTTTTTTSTTTSTTTTPAPAPTSEPEPEPTTSSTVAPTSTTAADISNWTDFPANGEFSYEGFGGRTEQSVTGNKFTYQGNVGNPWGSNIIEVSAERASEYKYVIQFHGSKTDKLTVVVWNKIGPDMQMTGWYSGNAAVSFTLEPGEIRYVAVDENTQGSFGAAKGDSLPTDEYGGYSCTWGEFDLGSTINGGWSGWDVSAIQAEAAGQHIQGMKMCSYLDDNCSIITTGAAKVVDAYMEKDKWVDGIGGKVIPGPVRIVTHLDYDE